MPGVHNSLHGCPCGFLHARTDPMLKTLGVVGIEWWPPGVLKQDKINRVAVLRACRSCRQVYALTYNEDDKLPDQGEGEESMDWVKNAL